MAQYASGEYHSGKFVASLAVMSANHKHTNDIPTPTVIVCVLFNIEFEVAVKRELIVIPFKGFFIAIAKKILNSCDFKNI